METYKVIDEWPAVKMFAINNLSSFKTEMGFMYRGNEIIVRSQNDQALKILRKNFDLIACEQPSNILDSDSGWSYFGNSKVFEFKL